jgi:hypothetical protein
MKIPITVYETITHKTTLDDLFDTVNGGKATDAYGDTYDVENTVVIEKGYLVYTI